MVEKKELHQYKDRFGLDENLVQLELARNKATWNPPPRMVAIYEAMLIYGVTLPL